MSVLPLLLYCLLSLKIVHSQDNTPDVTLSPDTLSVNAGQEASFNCTPLLAQASSLLNTIDPDSTRSETVQNDDSRLNIIDIPPVEVENVTRVRVFMWVNPTLAEDHGRQFSCQVGSFESNTVSLFINHPPSITIPVTEFTPTAGESIDIAITVGGWPEPSLAWTLNEATITPSLTGSALSLSSVSLDDAGVYTLTASNAMGDATANFTVIVRSPPVFNVADGSTVSVKPGDELIINCAVQAFPLIACDNVTLTRGDSKLALDSNYTHTIPRAQTSDADEYVCTATNELGTESVTILVDIEDVPDRVSNIKVTTDNDILTVTWDAGSNNGVRIVNYTVEIKYRNKSIVRTVTETMLMLGLKLPEGVVYTVIVHATNGIGNGESTTLTGMFDPTFEGASSALAVQSLLSVFLIVVCSVFWLL